MSEIYNVYEKSFSTLCKNIDSTLNKEEYNKITIEKLRNDIKEINRLLKQMNLEINNLKLSKQISKEIDENLLKYKCIVDEYNNKLLLIQNEYCFNHDKNNKNILIDDDDKREAGLIEDDYYQQEKINTIHRDVYDIEHIGNEIGNNLDYQNDQIKYMNNNIKMMSHEADIANDLVNHIINRSRRNKIIFYVILFALIFIFCIVMIIKKTGD